MPSTPKVLQDSPAPTRSESRLTASHSYRSSTIFNERPLRSTATGQLNGKSGREADGLEEAEARIANQAQSPFQTLSTAKSQLDELQ